MDKLIIKKLKSDQSFEDSITKLVKNFVEASKVNQTDVFRQSDINHDMFMAWASLSKKDNEALSKGHPARMVIPLTATHCETYSTFMAQTFTANGGPFRVEGRQGTDAKRADQMNYVLGWNNEQQQVDVFTTIKIWAQDSFLYNKGVIYDSVDTKFQLVQENVTVETGEHDEAGNPITEERTQIVRKKIGTYCKFENISFYDFFHDTAYPIHMLQKGRFAGHSLLIHYNDLKRMADLDVDDPSYVMPEALDRLEEKTKGGGANSMGNLAMPTSNSGSGRNRNSTQSPTEAERLSAKTNVRKAGDKDKGFMQCQLLWANIVPADYEISEDDYPKVWQFLVCNNVVLSMNESTYLHGNYPYAVGCPRPDLVTTNAPSWASILRPIQGYIDYLNNRHREAVGRAGLLMIVDPEGVDVEDFNDPNKESKFLFKKPGTDMNSVFKEITVPDVTANFQNEIKQFQSLAENTTGATQALQGQTQDASSATQFAATQQMATGRMSSQAKLLSGQGLMPLCRRLVNNFQTFFDQTLVQNVVESQFENGNGETIKITNDTIQGNYDYIVHDGTMPPSDAKTVAGLSKCLEMAAALPQIATVAVGGINLVEVAKQMLALSGVKLSSITYKSNDPEIIAQTQTQAQAPQLTPPASGQIPGQIQPVGMGTPGPKPPDASVRDESKLSGNPSGPSRSNPSPKSILQ